MRQANKGGIGTIMVTPSKLPANDSLPPLMRTIVISIGLLAFAPSEAAKPLPVLTAENAVGLCRQLFDEPKEYIDDAAQRRRRDLRRES
jgi:hypothetical protein